MAVCNGAGSPLILRLYSQTEYAAACAGLLSFSRLFRTNQQHTFVDTDLFRFLYYPLDGNHLILATDKDSNILLDMECLNRLVFVLRETCSGSEEKAVIEHSFDLIFAFDELILCGTYNALTNPQLSTALRMESNEEVLQEAITRVLSSCQWRLF